MSDLVNEVTSTTQEEKVSQSGQQDHDEELPQSSTQPAPSEGENFDVTDEYDVAASLSGALAEHALNPDDDSKTNTEEEITSRSEETDYKPVAAAGAAAMPDTKENTEEVKPIDSSTGSSVRAIEILDLDSDEPKINDEPQIIDEPQNGGLDDGGDDAGLQVAKVGAEQEEEGEEDEDDIEDETIVERLVGLTEMFPDVVRNGVCSITSKSVSLVKNSYSLSRTLMWVFFSSSSIMVAPLFFEMERLQAQRTLGKEMLLGPGAQPGGAMMGMPSPPVK